MVKNKKMSKTSIAIVVLAVLLVLSMVMGLTGAWFTAKSENNTAGSNTITFGKIAITATPSSLSADWDDALPGDSKNVGATVELGEGSEALFFIVEASGKLVDDEGNELELYRTWVPAANQVAAHGEDPVIEAQNLIVSALPTGWSSFTQGGKTIYFIPKGSAETMNLGATFTFHSATGNIAYDGDGQPVTLNGYNGDGIFQINVQIGAYAVQARHIGVENAAGVASLTSDQKVAIYNAIVGLMDND